MNDPYPDQLLATSRAVAEAVGVANWQFAWQSAGQTQEPWLGPDILVCDPRARRRKTAPGTLPDRFCFATISKCCTISILKRRLLQKSWAIELERTESLNTDPLYIETLG